MATAKTNTQTSAPTMAQITNTANAALQQAGLAMPAHPQLANVTLTLTKAGQVARPAVGQRNNVASWAGVLAVLQANGGTATGAQILAGIVAHNPGNIGNAAPFLGYVCNTRKMGWLAPAKAG